MTLNNLIEGKKCPSCQSTLFHVSQKGDVIVLRCYRTKKCGWEKTLRV